MRDKVQETFVTRRGFLKAATAGAVAVAGGKPEFLLADAAGRTARAGIPNPYMKGGKPLVVVVEGTDPMKMLAAGIESLGGFGRLVKKGQAVVVKPNQGISTSQPYPTNANPDTVFGLIKLLREAGSGEVSICESPTLPGARKDESYQKNGYFERGTAEGIPIHVEDNSNDENFVAVHDPRWERFTEIRTLRRLMEAPVIINVSSLKRHNAPGWTSVLKNHFGTVRLKDRRYAHDQIKGEGGMRFFKEASVEFAEALRIELSIVDARSIMIKGGPSLGQGPAELKHNVNRIIISGSLMAAEMNSVRLLAEHDDTFSIAMADDTLAYAQRLGLGTGDPKQVELIERTVA